MSTENAADAAETKKPTATFDAAAGSVAQTVNANTTNNGPGGCQRKASDNNDAAAATSAPAAMSHHW